MTGNMMLIAAVFDTSSVSVILTEHIINVMANGGSCCNTCRLSPSTTDRPDSLHPLAMAKPPPSKSITDHDT